MLSMKDERPACLAAMRLAGYFCGQYVEQEDDDEWRASVLHAHDRHCVTSDTEHFTDEDCTFEQSSDGGWSILQPHYLPSMLPTVLWQLADERCPFSSRREFVAALLGSCGSVDTENARVMFSIASSRRFCRTLTLLLPSLLRSLGVKDCTVTVKADQSVLISLPSSSFLTFADTVGCRYNAQLSYTLAALGSYLRHISHSSTLCSSPSFEAYCCHIGCSDWFVASSSAFSTSSLPTFHLRLSSVTPAGLQPTYDLTVRHLHSFTANGLIVHNCLELSNDKLRTRLIDELTHPDRLPRLLSDPFANYCIQKALSVSKKGQAERLVAVIRPHLAQLRNTAFGKRIMNKISKRFELSEDELAGMFYRDGGLDATGAPLPVGVPGVAVGVGGGGRRSGARRSGARRCEQYRRWSVRPCRVRREERRWYGHITAAARVSDRSPAEQYQWSCGRSRWRCECSRAGHQRTADLVVHHSAVQLCRLVLVATAVLIVLSTARPIVLSAVCRLEWQCSWQCSGGWCERRLHACWWVVGWQQFIFTLICYDIGSVV